VVGTAFLASGLVWPAPLGRGLCRGGRLHPGAGLRQRRFPDGPGDLESLIGAAKSAIVVIYNEAAYGAEIHQYGSQGLTEKPMPIPRWTSAGSRARGAEPAIIRFLTDLQRSRTE